MDTLTMTTAKGGNEAHLHVVAWHQVGRAKGATGETRIKLIEIS